MAGDPLQFMFNGKKLNVDVTQQEIQMYARAETVRVLKPHTPMTMDLRYDRVNIHINEQGVIQQVYIG